MRAFELLAAAALVVGSTAAAAESKAVHRIVEPGSVPWGAGPAALERGANAAVLYGDPAKAELFVMRLWLPKGFRVAPHTHPRPEILTIISGSFLIGMGSDGDRARTRRLGPGTFSTMAPGTPHYAYTDQNTIIQISTMGPWSIQYLNPADDPRNRTKR